MFDDWPFEDPPNVAVLTVRRVLDGGAPILFVTHDEEDGGWQFLDGDPVNEADAQLVALRRIWRLDSTIAELADLPTGWQAILTNCRSTLGLPALAREKVTDDGCAVGERPAVHARTPWVGGDKWEHPSSRTGPA